MIFNRITTVEIPSLMDDMPADTDSSFKQKQNYLYHTKHSRMTKPSALTVSLQNFFRVFLPSSLLRTQAQAYPEDVGTLAVGRDYGTVKRNIQCTVGH